MQSIQTKKDQKLALDILVNEYFTADNVTWMLRRKTKKSMFALLKVLFYDALSKNGAFLSESRNGVVLLYKQENRKFTLSNFFRKVCVFLFTTGISKGKKAIKWQQIVNSIRPSDGWLGIAFAIKNDENKMKTAFEIKQEIISISKDSKHPIYAETTVPRIRLLYEKMGFKVYHEMEHSYAELKVWFLKLEVIG